VATALVVPLLPLLLAAAPCLLPEFARCYLPKLALPLLVAESAAVYGILVAPLICRCQAGAVNPGLFGAAHGLVIALLTIPFLGVAGIVAPIGPGTAAILAFIVFAAAGGSIAAATGFGPRGAAVAVGLMVLPGILGYVSQDVFPALAWLEGFSPLRALLSAGSGAGGWWKAPVIGIALIAAAGARAAPRHHSGNVSPRG
jgi:hypothetical protein